MLTGRQNLNLLLHLVDNKAKPVERRGRKATGPRFLREVMDDSPKDPKIAGLPTLLFNNLRNKRVHEIRGKS